MKKIDNDIKDQCCDTRLHAFKKIADIEIAAKDLITYGYDGHDDEGRQYGAQHGDQCSA